MSSGGWAGSAGRRKRLSLRPVNHPEPRTAPNVDFDGGEWFRAGKSRFGLLLSTIGTYASRCEAARAAPESDPVDERVMSVTFSLHFRIQFRRHRESAIRAPFVSASSRLGAYRNGAREPGADGRSPRRRGRDPRRLRSASGRSRPAAGSKPPRRAVEALPRGRRNGARPQRARRPRHRRRLDHLAQRERLEGERARRPHRRRAARSTRRYCARPAYRAVEPAPAPAARRGLACRPTWARASISPAATSIGGLDFLGRIVVVALKGALRPRRWRLTSTAYHLEQMGLRGAPLILMINFFVGAIVAQQGIVQLARFGAQQPHRRSRRHPHLARTRRDADLDHGRRPLGLGDHGRARRDEHARGARRPARHGARPAGGSGAAAAHRAGRSLCRC